MRLLAIDTSTRQTLWTGVTQNGMLDAVTLEEGVKHDSALAEGVRTWLLEHQWHPGQLDGVAVVTGPGGFTGLRVGVAFAVGFAEAAGIPVIPVDGYSLLAARVVDAEVTVWALPYGGRLELRGRFMTPGDDPQALGDVLHCRGEELSEVPLPEGAILPLGPAWERHEQRVRERLGAQLVEPSPGLRGRVKALAVCARQAFNRGELLASDEVDVDYGAEFRPSAKKGS